MGLRIITAFLIFASATMAQSWKDLVPLKSTRSDVKTLLGKPLFDENTVVDIYDVAEGRLNIMYVKKPCQRGLPANWGNWNVPVDTIVNITIHLKKVQKLVDLERDNGKSILWYTDDSGASYFQDKINGIEYSANDVGIVGSITYGPKKSDEKLMCRRDAPEIRY